MAKVVVQITLDTETNAVQIEGPFQDGILFLGMLEMARTSFVVSKATQQTAIQAKKEILIPQIVGPRKM